jgi:hypothetical protein
MLEEVDMRLIALSLALGAAASLASHSALALDSHCTSGNGKRGYDEGYKIESNLLEQIWSSRFSCNTVEQFVSAINVSLSAVPSSDAYLQCRNVGVSAAIQAQIYDKQVECSLGCYQSGSSIGTLNGEIYCGLPEEDNKRTGGYSICAVSSTQGCASALRSYVQSNCAAKAAADPGFEGYVRSACKL